MDEYGSAPISISLAAASFREPVLYSFASCCVQAVDGEEKEALLISKRLYVLGLASRFY